MINKAVRIITFAPFGNLDLNPAYRQLNLLSIDQTYQFEVAKFSYKFLCKSKTGEKSVPFKSFQMWKEIPHELKTSPSFNIFKKNFKKYLLGTYAPPS